MKIPRPITALAIVKETDYKISPLEVYQRKTDIKVEKGEKKCLVKVSFIRYVK